MTARMLPSPPSSASAPSRHPTANGARKKLSDAISPAAKITASTIQIIHGSIVRRLYLVRQGLGGPP